MQKPSYALHQVNTRVFVLSAWSPRQIALIMHKGYYDGCGQSK